MGIDLGAIWVVTKIGMGVTAIGCGIAMTVGKCTEFKAEGDMYKAIGKAVPEIANETKDILKLTKTFIQQGMDATSAARAAQAQQAAAQTVTA